VIKMKRTNRRPFCSRELFEAFKAMKHRELRRQNKSIPSCLLPTKMDEIYRNKPLRIKRAGNYD